MAEDDDEDFLDDIFEDSALGKAMSDEDRKARKREALRLALQRRPAPPVSKKMMLPFPNKSSDTGDLGRGYERVYWAQPQVHFKPKGLMIWGVPDDGDVTHIWIGRRLQVVATLGPIPAKWFSMAQSYEQIEQALKDGVEPPSWPDFDVVMVAQEVRVHIFTRMKLDDRAKIVMWGLGIEG